MRVQGDTAALLRQRPFALFLAAISVSGLGTAAAPVALSFALLATGASATGIGLALMAGAAPTIALMLAGGVVGDRWARRPIMVASDLLRLASQGALAVLLASGHPSLAIVMTLAACTGVGSAFYMPAESGLVLQVVGVERVKAANSIISIANSLAFVLGPSLGGLLVGFGGAPLAIGLDAASYGVSALCLAAMRVTAIERLPAASFLAEFRAGWREFSRHRWLQLIAGQFLLLNLFAFAPFVVLGAVTFAAMPHGPQLWGLVLSASGVGSLMGGLLVLRVRLARPGLAIEAATAVLAVPLILLAFAAPVTAIGFGSVLFGGAIAVLSVTLTTAMQVSVPEALLSRVSSILTLVAVGSAPVGYALCGPFAGWIGVQRAFGVGAAIILGSVAVLLGSRDIRSFKAAPMQAPDAGCAIPRG